VDVRADQRDAELRRLGCAVGRRSPVPAGVAGEVDGEDNAERPVVRSRGGRGHRRRGGTS